MKRWTLMVAELVVAVLVTMGAWTWASGITPGMVLAALRRADAPLPDREYDVIPLDWGGASLVRAISDAGQVVGAGTVGELLRVPVVWHDGLTTVCGACATPGRAVAVDELGRIACDLSRKSSVQRRCFVHLPEGDPVVLRGRGSGDEPRVSDMNNVGVAVGAVCGADGLDRACLWDAAAEVTVLDERPGQAVAITDGGTIVGLIADSSGRALACLWAQAGDGYRRMELPGQGGVKFRPRAMNNAGVVVGVTDAGLPFRWDPHRSPQILPVIDPSRYAEAIAINEGGLIVGYTNGLGDADGMHALLWCGEQMINLNDCIDPTCGWRLDRATAISNTGLIGCQARQSLGEGGLEAVLLVPRRDGLGGGES